MAFTAGTGCLVFVDLVAHIIRKNLKLLNNDEDKELASDFKFVFYVSFPNRKESVAMELIEGCHNLAKKRGLQNFELVCRFSNESKERWNDAYIERQLEIHQHQGISRVWVCGPPIMNEQFERALEKNAERFDLKHKYEIM